MEPKARGQSSIGIGEDGDEEAEEGEDSEGASPKGR